MFLLALLLISTLVLGFHVFLPAVESLSASKKQLLQVVDKLPLEAVGQLRRRYKRLIHLLQEEDEACALWVWVWVWVWVWWCGREAHVVYALAVSCTIRWLACFIGVLPWMRCFSA